jgi:hypothetical protein
VAGFIKVRIAPWQRIFIHSAVFLDRDLANAFILPTFFPMGRPQIKEVDLKASMLSGCGSVGYGII